MPNSFQQKIALQKIALIVCTLLAITLPAHADDIQDANKLFKQGQHSQALDKVNNYLAGKPKDAKARFLKGLILTEQGETTDAINIFTSLTADYPELPEPYNNLAVLYANQGQYDNAKLALEMAIRTHPSYATAHENLGDIYARMASQAYDRALQLDRSNTATQTKLAMIQELFAGGTRAKESTVHTKPEVTAPVPKAVVPETGAAETVVPAGSSNIAEANSSGAPAAATNSSSEVLQTINVWAAAWSAQDVDSYLSFYAADFKTPAGETRADWETARKQRISAPKSIRVDISNASVVFSDNDHATVKFRQSYRSSQLKTSGKKTLRMLKADGKWLIQEERAN